MNFLYTVFPSDTPAFYSKRSTGLLDAIVSAIPALFSELEGSHLRSCFLLLMLYKFLPLLILKSRNHPGSNRNRRPKQGSPAKQSKTSESSSSQQGEPQQNLSAAILGLLAKEPLDKVQITKKLGLPPYRRHQIRQILKKLEERGEVARVRRDRYIIPEKANLFTGIIQFRASGSAFVLNEKPGECDLFISAENTWTSMHGDRVVARITPTLGAPEWRPGETRKEEGRVIRILKRANETIVGTLQKSKGFYYIVADDPRFVHNLYVPEPDRALKAKIGDKVVARLEHWENRHVNPEGSVIEVLGRKDTPGIDMIAIVRKHRLPEQFPQEVVREAEAIDLGITPKEISKRFDLRKQPIFTIDPDDARDFDDAIMVERTRHGWAVGVHIADVAHYVRPNSILDREALGRGNSVYLPDRVIPMLPEALSNGICSLRPNEDRLTFSVFADISRKGVVSNVRFGKSVIRSTKRLTYKEAFGILQNKPSNELEQNVHIAWEAAAILRKRRFQNGSLDLDFPEAKVWLNELGHPVRIERIENDISHQLIEEFMLMANEAVARELSLKKQPTIYRIHENPTMERLSEFRELAHSYGLRCGDLNNRDELNKLLTKVRGQPHEFAIKLGLLKSLKRATYSHQPVGHFGLAKVHYLHFTSPIRRYADLIAHRSLARYIAITKSGPTSTELPALAEHISTTERTATDAEREAVRIKKLQYFQDQLAKKTGQVFEARIIEVRNYGLFVELPDYLLSGLIHVSALSNDFYHFDPKKAQLVGRKTRTIYKAGTSIEVTVARVDMFKQQVDFCPTGQ